MPSWNTMAFCSIHGQKPCNFATFGIDAEYDLATIRIVFQVRQDSF